MIPNTSENPDNSAVVAEHNAFYVRAIAAWILLLVPGFLSALMFEAWLRYFVVAPIVIAPLTIWAYDFSQFIKRRGSRSQKIILFFLMGCGLALLFSTTTAQFSIPSSALSAPFSTASTLTLNIESTDNRRSGAFNLKPDEALAQAKQLGSQAAEIVQAPPHPLQVWVSAEQTWQQAIQQLESIPDDAEVYEEAISKLAAYQANRNAIAERIATEKKALNDYETAQRLIDEIVMGAESIKDADQAALPIFKQLSTKSEMAIKAFQSIPSGTAASDLAQEKANVHRKIHQNLLLAVQTLESCESEKTFDCNINDVIDKSLFSNF